MASRAPGRRRDDGGRARVGVLALVGLAAAALLAGAAGVGVALTRPGGQAAEPRLPVLGPIQPVYDGDVGDPFLLRVGPAGAPGTSYQLFGTDDPPDHIPTATSADLRHWQPGPDALPVLPAWANPDPTDGLTWAPAATRTRAGFLLYVSVQDAASHRQCIAVTSSPVAGGPYRDALGAPLVCQVGLGGSIDPSVLTDSRGHLHLVWKSDGNCCGLPASIWVQDLTGDGRGVSGPAHLLLSADQPWQGGIIENPAMIPAGSGGYWLFYSGNQFNTAQYATGLAYCPTLVSACRETSSGPFLRGTATQYSPGGLDFFRDATGALWAAFATWNRPSRNGRFFCCRSLSIAAVR